MAETISRKSIVYDILFDIEKGKRSAKDAQKTLGNLDKQANKLGGSFSNLGREMAKSLAIQDAIKAIGQFTKEAIELALKADGVRTAFKALNNPALLDQLRKATKGTIDDLTLMQAAVKADKFKLPLGQLGNLLRFARERAKETGEEFDQITKKIIEGIGKKSPQALEDLGLSAKDIQREFSITGDFAKAAGNVIAREMQNSSAEVLSNAEKVEQLRTSWQNFKLDAGAAIVDNIDKIEGFAKALSMIPGVSAAFGAASLFRRKTLSEEEKQQLKNNDAAQAGADILSRLYNTALDTTGFSLNEITQRLKDLTEEFEKATNPKIQAGIAQQIQRFQQLKKAIEDLLTAAPAGTIKALEQQLARISEKLAITDPDSLLFAQLTKQSQLLSFELDRIKGQFENIKFTITSDEITTSTEKLARQFSFVSEAIDRVSADVRVLQSEFIELADGTKIKGLQQNTIRSMKEILEEQRELKKAERDLQIEYAQDALGALMELSGEGSKAQLAFSTVAIFANQAQALSAAIAAATQLSLKTGGAGLPVLIPAFVSIALSTFAQVNTMLAKAKAAQGEMVAASAFAEGEVDIHRPGEIKGKDSIPAVIMPGESVLTAEKTRKHRPLIEAIHAGNIDDLIRVNYVEPALALQALDGAANGGAIAPDYSNRFYRQYLATGEGNVTSKRMLNVLGSIDRKLSANKKQYRN